MSDVLVADNSPEAPAPAGWHRGLYRLALVVVPLTLLVVLLGGKTKSKEAGLTIAEPFMFTVDFNLFWIENISAEYSHRAAVLLLSIGVLSLTVWTHISSTSATARRLTRWLAGLVLAQAVLGALTVHFMAKPHASIPHGVLGQVIFALAVSLAVVTSKKWLTPAPAPLAEDHPGLRRLAFYLLIALFVQLLLGAALRHDNKGATLRSDGGIFSFIWHLVAHLCGAFAVIVCAARVISRVFSRYRQVPGLVSSVRWIMILLTVQFALGLGAAVAKVMYSRTFEEADAPPPIRVLVSTSHQTLGAIILALSAVLLLQARKFAPATSRSATVSTEASA
jgi:cytochrome c oxidase assembly protein subunit 15